MQLPTKNKTQDFASRFFTVIVALSPVFATYASGIPGFTVADILLVLFTGYSLLHPHKHTGNQYSVNLSLLLLGLSLILIFDILAMFSERVVVYDVVIRTVRYFFYMFCFLFTAKRLIDVKLLKSCVKNISIAAAAYILLQFVLYQVFEYVLKGFIPLFQLYVADYANQDYAALYYAQMYRPTSFFLEPAHFARYAVIGVLLILWNPKIRLKDILLAIFVSFGVLLSTSAHGYAILLLVWVLFAFVCIKKLKNSAAKLLSSLGVILSPVLLVFVLQIPFVNKAVTRVLSGSVADTNTALGGRLGGFGSFEELPIFHKIFGMGLGSIPEDGWLSSAAYWLYGCGVIVFAVYIFFMLNTLFKLKGDGKIIFLIFFILFFTDDAFYSYMCVLFYSLTLLTRREEVPTCEKTSLYRKRVPIRQRHLY